MNFKKYKICCINKGINTSEIAVLMGIHRMTLYSKLQGRIKFSDKDLKALKKILNLNNEEFIEIFFED